MQPNEMHSCVICGHRGCRALCAIHRKQYRYVKKYGIFALQPRKGVSEPQTALFKVIRAMFKEPVYQEVIFDWNMYHRYDIIVPDHKLCVEYDGEQHFKFVKLFHKTKEGFNKSKEVEAQKEASIRGHGFTVVRFSYIQNIDDPIFVEKVIKLKMNGKNT